MEERKNRDQIVLATKFTTFFPSGKGGEKINSNFQGNHSKSLRVSTEASLRKLKTSYIDLVSFRVENRMQKQRHSYILSTKGVHNRAKG